MRGFVLVGGRTAAFRDGSTINGLAASIAFRVSRDNMKLPKLVARRLASAVLIGSGCVAPALAQVPATYPAITDANAPVERLGRYIRVLAAAPRDLDALLGAGQAALDVGDANAALGFFARAEEVAPSNGRAKAGLGAALVTTERPDDALRLFGQAIALGVPERDVARDRGLAYDLRGDPRRAQRDYVLALTRAGDDELLRRYGLSLGISGDRQAALATIDPLLRKQDQGAWRARAFILAMTGDVSGANRVAHQLMVPAMADAMSPLLARLATLNAAQRAHAVNFGTVPAAGTQMATVVPGDPYLPSPRPPSLPKATDIALIPQGEPLGPRAATRASASATGEARIAFDGRTRPAVPAPAPAVVAISPRASSAPPTVTARPSPYAAIGRRIAAIDPARLSAASPAGADAIVLLPGTTLPPPDGSTARAEPKATIIVPSGTLPVTANTAAPTQPGTAPRAAVVPSQVASAITRSNTPLAVAPKPELIGPPTVGPFEVPAAAPEQGARPVTAGPAPVPRPVTPAPTRPTPAPGTRLAGLLEGVEREPDTNVELPSARELRAARAAGRKKLAELAAQTAKEKAAKDAAAAQAAEERRFPARIWIQVATGSNDRGLATTWHRIQNDNQAALRGLTAWSSPFKATNRVLAGPVKSAAAARELVRALGKNGLSAMTYASAAGEEVFKIAAK